MSETMPDGKWESVREEFLRRISQEDKFVRAVLSGKRRNFSPPAERIDIKPVAIKGGIFFQTSYFSKEIRKETNLTFSQLQELNLLESGFANLLVEIGRAHV